MNQNITSDGWLLVRVWCLCDCLNFNAHYTLFVRTLFDWSLQVLALVDATRRSMGVKSQVNQVDLIHHTSDDEFEHYVFLYGSLFFAVNSLIRRYSVLLQDSK